MFSHAQMKQQLHNPQKMNGNICTRHGATFHYIEQKLKIKLILIKIQTHGSLQKVRQNIIIYEPVLL